MPRLIGGRRGGGLSFVAPAVAVHRMGVGEIAQSPRHCFRTVHPCAQSVKRSPTEPVLSRCSRQILGHFQSHVNEGWHICQAVFPEPHSDAARRGVERRDCALAFTNRDLLPSCIACLACTQSRVSASAKLQGTRLLG